MRRSKQSLSHYRLQTCDMGELMPIACVPVLPGDTIQHSTSLLVRVSPLNTPVMHPVNVRLHHFFVPNRIVWEDWEDFITGGEGGFDTSTPPTIPSPGSGTLKTVTEGLGVPVVNDTGTVNVNALSLRAFNLIFNEWYRDQDLVTKRDEDDNTLPNIAWEKDYFTTARPWTQKGPEVTVPIGTDVLGGNADGSPHVSPQWENLGGDLLGATQSDLGTGGDEFGLYTDPNTPPADEQVRFAEGQPIGAHVDNASASINAFREAFAIQRYQEARARYGSRFTEYLRYLGIRPSDARLQRPEYLGGGSTRLNFSEVLQTTPNDEADTAGVGDLYGHGIAGVRSRPYRKFFEEHGYIITCFSARPKATYVNALNKEFLKRDKESYYQKELVHLGQQAVDNRELYMLAPPGDFGYQDRYDEYRSHPSQVSHEFRDVLDSWHMGRRLTGSVQLNDAFIECEPDKRIYQVTNQDGLWIMANHNMVARRLLPKRSTPKVL